MHIPVTPAGAARMAHTGSPLAGDRDVAPAPVLIERGENAVLCTAGGARLIDFSANGGAGVTGHRHPVVISAMRAQLDRLVHVGAPFASTAQATSLADRLETLAPIAAPCSTAWATTGAEAVELAVTMARLATGRRAVLAFAGAWHGETGMARALSGVRTDTSSGGDAGARIQFLPFPHAATGAGLDDMRRSLQLLFRTRLAPQEVAAVVIECVQGEAGVLTASATLLHDVRALCDRHGIVLIVDESRTALARTGKLFALEHFDIEADLIVLADGLSDGLPLAAVIGRQPLVQTVQRQAVQRTMWGHAVAAAAAHAVLDVIHDDMLCSRAADLGRAWMNRMQDARRTQTAIADLRGLGAMRAVEFRRPSGEPDVLQARVVADAAIAAGVLVSLGGSDANVIRFQFPLTLSDDDLGDGIDRFVAAMNGAQA
ncbi:aminotransferase class III-fold pyridoxal phosphate-dependent enzyme [Alcaligenaceae bacterium A4P071]|nr:aminotransferase class III-fold pyridoxal phosphate-dependent enzyme [Alcaligenaceae bacterium A4P071]